MSKMYKVTFGRWDDEEEEKLPTLWEDRRNLLIAFLIGAILALSVFHPLFF